MNPLLRGAVPGWAKRGLAPFLAAALRWSRARVGLALVYHGVAERGGDPDRDLVPVISSSAFAGQVAHLVRRYRVVPAGALYEAVRARRRGDRLPVAITFDDDLASHRSSALPVLQAHGAPATFFLCGASLTEPHAFWWERLQRYADEGRDLAAIVAGSTPTTAGLHEVAQVIELLPPRERQAVSASLAGQVGPDPADAGLRAGEVEALAAAPPGVEIGFHTRSHDRLTELDDDQLVAALTTGRDDLAAACGRSLTVLAYPHGAADGRTAAAARHAGFSYAFTTSGSAVTPASDPHLLGRVDPSFVPPGEFAWWVARQLGRRRPDQR